MKTENLFIQKSLNHLSAFLRTHDRSNLAKALSRLSGFEIAKLLLDRPLDQQLAAFCALTPTLAAETLDYLSEKQQETLLSALPVATKAPLLEAMHPDDRTALLKQLPQPLVEECLKLLSPVERTLTLTLLGYPEDRVGHIMTTDYLTIKLDWTVDKVLDHIRAYGHDSETINELYVVDESNKLLDDIKIKDFLFTQKEAMVAQIANFKFVSLNVNDKAEQAINVFKEYDRAALPVIDDAGILLGIVTIDDILRYASEMTTEDMQKVSGMEALDEPYMETPFFELMKRRARWLIILFIGETFTATAMGIFEAEIAKAVVLALFIPLIISSGGNAGSQSTTLIIQAMALGEVKLKDWWRVMRREFYSGLFLGTTLGTIGFLRVALWAAVTTIYGEHWMLIAFTIFFALIGVVLWGSLMGSMLPLMLRRVGIDPATASAPLVATLVDVTGITIYFGIAMVVLQGSLL